MQIKIAARHGGQLDTDCQQRMHDKASRLLHFFDRISLIEITVDLDRKEGKWVEIKVDAEHKHDFVAHETHPDLNTAVDLVVEKIKQQIRRYKERIQDHRTKPEI